MTRPSIHAFAVAAIVASSASLGCQAFRANNHYRASELPAGLVAKPGAGAQRIDMASLVSTGGGSAALGPADVVELTVVSGLADEGSEPQTIRVAENGAVDVPYIGPVVVAGMEPSRAAEAIAREAMARGVYVRPQVTLAVAEQATHRVTVLGAVEEPGVQEVPRSACDLVTALASAGGLTEDAGTVVEILRHGSRPPTVAAASDGVRQASYQPPNPATLAAAGPLTERIDLAAGDAPAAANQRLGDRDVIIVRPREKRVVHVSGLVRQPNQFELTEDHDLRLLDAVAMAGGASSVVADKVLILRQAPGSDQPAVIKASLADAKRDGRANVLLGPGDLVTVEPTVATTVLDVFNTMFRVTMGVGGNLTLF
ncbi:MAG: polysaccharide biosynthesis/export family protein [Planctomycetota bacterium]